MKTCWGLIFVGMSSVVAACSNGGGAQGIADSGVHSSTGGEVGTGGSSTGGASTSASGGNAGSSTGGTSGEGTGGAETGGAENDSGPVSDCSSCTAAGTVCVEHQLEGGALFRADAGRCPNGRIAVGSICQSPPSFECQHLPAACQTAPGSLAIAHCTCARSLCGSANLCEDVTPTHMKCTLQAP
jgi:hypothetical protein